MISVGKQQTCAYYELTLKSNLQDEIAKLFKIKWHFDDDDEISASRNFSVTGGGPSLAFYKMILQKKLMEHDA